jgi:hypothetical protein
VGASVGSYLEKQAGHQARHAPRSRHAQRDAGQRKIRALPQDQAQHIARLRSQRHTNSDLRGSLLHRVGHQAVQTNQRQKESQAAKYREQQRLKPALGAALETNWFIVCKSVATSEGSRSCTIARMFEATLSGGRLVRATTDAEPGPAPHKGV